MSFSFDFFKEQRIGYLCPNKKVLVAKIDLHKMEWVYCSKTH